MEVAGQEEEANTKVIQESDNQSGDTFLLEQIQSEKKRLFRDRGY